MNLVSLDDLNRLRFPQSSVKLTKLQRWCRAGALPARKLGGEWYVDLDEFDRQKPAPKQDLSAHVRLVVDRMRSHA